MILVKYDGFETCKTLSLVLLYAFKIPRNRALKMIGREVILYKINVFLHNIRFHRDLSSNKKPINKIILFT